MNIGILTYQFGTNFGGQLQCHALFNVLTSMGHNVTIINYIPNKTRNAVYKDIKKALKELKKGCNYDRINTAYHILMSSRKMRTAFRNYQTAFLKIGLECTSPQEIVSKYPSLDAIIVGSDQVWAPAHHKSGVYFLNFTPPFRGKKIAYAPCCAINRVDQLYRQQTVKCLKNFDNFVNPSLMSFSFKNRLNHLNERIKQLYQKRQIATLKATLTNSQNVEESIDFKVEKEEIIHEIKRIIDLLIMTTAIVHSGIPYFSAKDRIEIDCIGKLLSHRYSPNPIVKDALLVKKYKSLLQLINNLHNGLKHDLLAEEYVTDHRNNEVVINVAKFKDHKRTLKQIDVFSIPLNALLYACNDYISDVLLQKKTSEIYIRWAVLPAGSRRL